MNRQAGGNEQKKEGNQERKADPKRDDSSSEDPREDDVDGRQDEKKPTVYQRFTDSLESVLQQVVNAGTAHVGGSQPKKLSAFTLDGIAKFIQDGHARKIIVMTGAGISTSAGIPDFRSPNSGLYAKLAATATDLGDPTDMFSIDFFRRDPVPFYRRARDIFPETAKPTPAHHFVRLIEKKGLLLRWFTQNVDALEHAVGCEPARIVEAHGSYRSATCLKCNAKYDEKWVRAQLAKSDPLVPHCSTTEGCEGVVKPDITFFGESMPARFFQHLLTDFPQCDLLIIMGTSLVVQPFASLVDEVPPNTPRLLINREAVGRQRSFTEGLCYHRTDNTRDVFWDGSCDDGVRRLADALGWREELERQIAEANPGQLR